MKVSIITVAYNAAETIEATLQSVASQDYRNIEYLVVDGASTDGTLDILERYADKVHVLISEKDKGIYDAMNKGLARCTGDVVGILNSDDTFADAKVVSDVIQCMSGSGVDACYADLQYVDRHDVGRVIRHWKSGPFIRESFRKGWMPPHPTFFLKRQAYEKFGGFRIDMRSSADYELMLRMLYKEGLRACYLPRVTVLMKTGGQSNASLRNRWAANREDRAAWRVNRLSPMWYTLWWKPLRKIGQYFKP